MDIKELIIREEFLKSSVKSKTCELEDLSAKHTLCGDRIKQITPLVQQCRDQRKYLKDLQNYTNKIKSDIGYIRTSLLWRLLNLFGYSKERALVGIFVKTKRILIERLFPDDPLPACFDDIDHIIKQINSQLKNGRASLDELSILEKENQLLSNKTGALKSSVEKEKVALAETTRKIEDKILISGEPLDVDAGVKTEDICRFKEALVLNDVQAETLTEKQWEFITSVSRNTYVIAGAGSGKSLSLVYRVIFLYKCLHIKLDEITLFTFTRKTRMELVDKLRRVLLLFGENYSEDHLKRMVHTFHSKAWHFGGKVLTRNISDYFEMLGKPKKEKNKSGNYAEDDDIDTANCLSFEISRETNSEQYKLLNQVYVELFNQNERFKKLVFEFYGKAFLLGSIKDYKNNAYQYAVDADVDFIQTTGDFAKEFLNKEDIFEKPEPFEISHNGDPYKLHAHVIISLPLGGIPTEYFIHYMYVPDGEEFQQTREIRKKKKTIIITHDAQRNHVFIHNEADYNQWKKYKNDLIQHAEKYPLEPPYFDYTLPGYISSKLFLNILYAEGSFIENLGQNVVDTCEDILKNRNRLDYQSFIFAEALKIFWQAFTKYIESNKRGIGRFHEVFLSRSYDQVEGQVSRMKNVLIDEFQDINTEISDWIKGALTYLKSKNNKCSITCVGDDYQSIYGWRGSAPVFFLNYEDNYPSRDFKGIQLEHNFRSLKVIIKTGEYVLKNIGCAIPDKKKGIQGRHNLFPIDDSPVEIYSKSDTEEMENTLNKILQRYSHELYRDTSIFVMSRTKDIINELEPKFKREKLEFITYHGSKGREADICVLLNDSFYNNLFPLRNRVYLIAFVNQKDYNQTYDEAQGDEAKRLGYVAITRAMKKVIILDNTYGKNGFIESAKEFVTDHKKRKSKDR